MEEKIQVKSSELEGAIETLDHCGFMPVILFPEGVKRPIRVSFHANEDDDPVKVIDALSVQQAEDAAEGILKESDSVYCARIWDGSIPCETLYRAGGIVFNCNVLGILSREKAEAEALDVIQDGLDPEEVSENSQTRDSIDLLSAMGI